jgi:hypothetical protein
MSRLVRVLSLVVACLVMVGQAAAYTLVSQEGRFSIEFLAEPKFEKFNEKTDAGYFVERPQWLLDRGTTAWIVSYGDYPLSDVQRIGAENMYDNSTRGAVEAVKGKLEQSVSVNTSGVQGREIFVLVPGGNMSMRQRFFVTGNRLYQNVYVGPAGSERDATVEAFLASFKINK